MSIWETVARKSQELYGSYIDWEERFFIDGECAEPIYEEDYNSFEDFFDEEGNMICPVCEEIIASVDEL